MTDAAPAEMPAPIDVDRLTVAIEQAGIRLARLEVAAQASSTNTVLIDRLSDPASGWQAPSVLIAEHQFAGRGRRDRTWLTPPRTALTVSIAVPVPPGLPPTLLPLIAGLATCGAVREATALPTGLKWPNDALIQPAASAEIPPFGRWRKVAGILVQIAPGQPADLPIAVVGIGLNVHQTQADLPVDHATSLDAARGVLAGQTTDRTALAASVIQRVVDYVVTAREFGPDPLLDLVAAETITLGQRVRVEPVAGDVVTGMAVGLGPTGELIVRTDAGTLREIHAGDVEHLR